MIQNHLFVYKKIRNGNFNVKKNKPYFIQENEQKSPVSLFFI